MMLSPAWLSATFGVWFTESEWLAAMLLANAWQSVAIALFLAVLLRLVPRLSAREQCRLWTAGIAAGGMLPLLSITSFGTWYTPVAARVPTTAIAPFHMAPAWSTAIALAWMLACLGAALRFAAGTLAVVRLLHHAQPAPVELARAFPQVRLLMSLQISAPVTTGFLRPAILLPAQLLQTLSPQQLEQVLLHELAHARRRDHQANLLIRLLRCVLPLNPALLYMDRRLAAARELACDDAVLSCLPAPKAYAACLLRVAECARTYKSHVLAPGLLGLLGRRSHLAYRVAHILAPPASGKRAGGSALLTMAAGGALAIFTVQLHAVPALVSFDSGEAPPTLAARQIAAPLPAAQAVQAARLQPVRLARRGRAHVSVAPHLAVAVPASVLPSPYTDSREQPPAAAQLVVYWQHPVQSSPENVPGTFVLLVLDPSHWLLYRAIPGGLLRPI